MPPCCSRINTRSSYLAGRLCGPASDYGRAGSTGVYTAFAIDLFQDAGFDLTLSKLPAGFNNSSAIVPVMSLSSAWTGIVAGVSQPFVIPIITVS